MFPKNFKNFARRNLPLVTGIETAFPPFPIDLSRFAASVGEAFHNPGAFSESVANSSTFITFKFILAFLSMIFLAGIVTLFPKITEAEERRRALLRGPLKEKVVSYPPRWEVVLSHLESGNAPEWKLAVLEADNILAEVLHRLGCPGNTIGDMLKSLKPGDILSINDAWEAHKVRNSIAHEGSKYELSYRDAARTIDQYETVFREVNYLQ